MNIFPYNRLGDIHKGRPTRKSRQNRTCVWTSEIEKIIFALFPLFLLKIISAYASFCYLAVVSMLSCVEGHIHAYAVIFIP